MKRLHKINLTIFVLFVLLPHATRLVYKYLNSDNYLYTIQYISLLMSLLGGVFLFIFNFLEYRKKNILYYSNSLILFALFGLAIALVSAFLILLVYSLRKGIGF